MLLWFFGASQQRSGNGKIFIVDLTQETLSLNTHGIESLHFSACGKQIIVQEMGMTFPLAQSIESNPAYQQARGFSQPHLDPNIPSRQTGPNEYDEKETAVTILGESMATGQLFLSGASTSRVNVSLYRNQRTVQLTTVSDSGLMRETQHLVSLPDSWDVVDSKTDLSVSAGSTRENNIRIILNMTSKPWYNLDDGAETHLPAMIWKDSRALLPPRSRMVSSSGKRASSIAELEGESEVRDKTRVLDTHYLPLVTKDNGAGLDGA